MRRDGLPVAGRHCEAIWSDPGRGVCAGASTRCIQYAVKAAHMVMQSRFLPRGIVLANAVTFHPRCKEPPSAMNFRSSRHLWTIVLAGGEGVRLRPLTRAIHGEDCPKQFAMIHGGQSLLQATLLRVQRWSAPERTVVVVAREREALAREQLAGRGPIDIVAQPSNRGTGPGLLLPLSRILALDPLAHVVVVPSDHYVRDALPFEHSVQDAIESSRDELTLIGAVPERAETQYGWIVRRTREGLPADVVECFCEKPPATVAEQLLLDGALWNTFVMAGSVRRFWQLACEHLPVLAARFGAYSDAVGTPDEALTLHALYLRMPSADFSRDLLEKARDLRVVALRRCGWSDWGTPERVLESLRDHSDYEALSERLALAG
jgi:mannose-1-phosphate guanylyltransferase